MAHGNIGSNKFKGLKLFKKIYSLIKKEYTFILKEHSVSGGVMGRAEARI